ncbi:MAG: patatin-like phospholipase family protein [Clostridia bacterium]
MKALEEEKINFEYISGTSSGSIVACLYAVRLHYRRNI